MLTKVCSVVVIARDVPLQTVFLESSILVEVREDQQLHTLTMLQSWRWRGREGEGDRMQQALPNAGYGLDIHTISD